MPKTPHWEAKPDPKDYAAAATYLSLLMPEAEASRIAAAFEGAPVVFHRANDLLRASALALLSAGDPAVAKDLKKINTGTLLSPVLLLRGRSNGGSRPLTVADGYHRICASYHFDPDVEVPCQIVDLPE